MKLPFRRPGPPIRFLYLVLGLWIGGRAIATAIDVLDPAESIGVRGRNGTGAHTAVRDDRIADASLASKSNWFRWDEGALAEKTERHQMPDRSPSQAGAAFHITDERPKPTLPEDRHSGDQTAPTGQPVGLPEAVPLAAPNRKDRWSLSTWMLFRPDNRARGLASGGQLGASQAGARLAYDLSPAAAHHWAVYGRVTSALQDPAAPEAALGLAFQPSRSLPVALSVERRIALGEGGRDAFAVYLAGGLGPVPVGSGIEAEGYAQAGVVGAKRTDAFMDGRIAIAGRLIERGAESYISAGLAVSGGAQPGLSRLDAGPHVTARFPLGSGYARASVEWRERLLGDARPDSGLALVLAADF